MKQAPPANLGGGIDGSGSARETAGEGGEDESTHADSGGASAQDVSAKMWELVRQKRQQQAQKPAYRSIVHHDHGGTGGDHGPAVPGGTFSTGRKPQGDKDS